MQPHEVFEIDQALHGYDKGHRLLSASTQISSEDDRAMLTMSDLSGSRVVEGFFEYLTGYMLPSNEFFAVAKTWYATEMRRPGCVWTHTLLLPISVVNQLRNAEALLPMFVRPQLDLKFKYSDKLFVPSLAFRSDPAGADPFDKERMCATEELYRYDKGSVGISVSSGTACELFLLKIWSQMWPELREDIGFCSGSMSLRILNGKPLDLQCGPERIVRELKTNRDGACTEAPWVQVVLNDLQRPGLFRQFLRDNASELTSRSSMSTLAEIFGLLSDADYLSAVRKVAAAFPHGGESLNLKRSILRDATQSRNKGDVSVALDSLSAGAFDGAVSDLREFVASLVQPDVRGFVLAFDSLRHIANQNYISVLTDVLTSQLTQTDFEWMSEATPELFNAVLMQRPAIAYQSSFWRWGLSLFEKVDLFRSLIRQPGLEKGLLFEAVFTSGDGELLSRLVGELSDNELPLVLEWIQNNDKAATSLEWTAFLREHQLDFVSWLNHCRRPTLQTVVLAANVLDPPPPLHILLSTETILALAKAVHALPEGRHEVAAFLYVTAAWVRQEEAGSIFVGSFAVLHKAMAQSRLSNRAWQLISSNLASLPYEQWDSCEKLRRTTLHFFSVNGWNFRLLWGIIQSDIDLFYDFTRTARSYDEGRLFLRAVYDASEHGDISLEKRQSKELRKLFGKNWWTFSVESSEM